MRSTSLLLPIAVSTAMTVLLLPHIARACSPVPPPPTEPCETLRLYTPAAAFPVNLAPALRIGGWQVHASGAASVSELDPEDPFIVERATEDGWALVDYLLFEQPNLVEGVRQLMLSYPVDGAYRVVWAGSTCDEPWVESDHGSGHLIGAFTMTEHVPYPADLGTITTAWALDDRVFHLGVGGDCAPIESRGLVGVATISVDLPAAWLPWADAASIAVLLDGEIERGFADVTAAQAASGRYTTAIETLCSTADASLYDLYAWGPRSGTHTVQLAARVGDFDEVRSSEAQYSVSCPAPGDDDVGPGGDPGAGSSGDPDGGGSGGPEAHDDAGLVERSGCSVRPRCAPRWIHLLVLVPLVGRRRPRRGPVAA